MCFQEVGVIEGQQNEVDEEFNAKKDQEKLLEAELADVQRQTETQEGTVCNTSSITSF